MSLLQVTERVRELIYFRYLHLEDLVHFVDFIWVSCWLYGLSKCVYIKPLLIIVVAGFLVLEY